MPAPNVQHQMNTDMTETTTTADINDHNDSNADAGDGQIAIAAATTSSGWPYSACSGILDRELTANIRAWALTHMSQTELHSYSQRQLLSMYLEQHIRPTLERVAPGMRMAEGPEVAHSNRG
jgi:hypothetical protein